MRNGDVYAQRRRLCDRLSQTEPVSHPGRCLQGHRDDRLPRLQRRPRRIQRQRHRVFDARTLVFVNSSNGRLYRVDTVRERIRAIDLDGRPVTFGDGLERVGGPCT